MNRFLLLLPMLFCLNVFAQDLIVTQRGTKIHCKVVSEDSMYVKYKRVNDMDGEVCMVRRNSIASIEYEKKQMTSADSVLKNRRNCDVIIEKSGDSILCFVQMVGEDIISYKKLENPQGPAYTVHTMGVSQIRYANGQVDHLEADAVNKNLDKKNKKDYSQDCNKLGSDILWDKSGKLYRGRKKLGVIETSHMMEACAPEYKAKYKGGHVASIVGKIPFFTGIVFLGMGVIEKNLVASKLADDSDSNTLIEGGMVMVSIGAPLMIGGKCIERNNLKAFYRSFVHDDAYVPMENECSPLELNFVGGYNKVGLSLTF
jgi:hypothetical protein